MRPHWGVLLLTAACSSQSENHPQPAPIDPVLNSLRKMEMHLAVPGFRLIYIEHGKALFRSALTSIREGKSPPGAVPAEQVRARIAVAPVVLVADSHDVDLCRIAFRRIVEDLSSPEAANRGHVAIALEAIPIPLEARVARDRARGDPDRLLSSLQAAWGWPVQQYADLLLRPRLRSLPLLAVGEPVPPPPSGRAPGVPDAKRVPPPMSWEDLKEGETFGFKNTETAKKLQQWLEESGGQVFVLYGTWHLTFIRELLAERGIDSVILVPFLTDVELALRERLGAGAEGQWFELAPGVFRAPYVKGSEVTRPT